MSSLEQLRPALRAVVAKGGDVVSVALVIRAHNVRGSSVLVARLLREEFGLSIPEALTVAAWAEGDGDDDMSRADLRVRIKTPLTGR